MSRGREWYERRDTPPIGEWWWAIEHVGHPAFYLRSLMPGDFAPGRLPLPRHALTLSGVRVAFITKCGTCGEVPASEQLEPIERQTGERGFFAQYRERGEKWPPATDPSACWLCNDRSAGALSSARVGDQDVSVCSRCSGHLARNGG